MKMGKGTPLTYLLCVKMGKGTPLTYLLCVHVYRGQPAGAGPLPPRPADPAVHHAWWSVAFPAEPCRQPFPEEDLG